MERIVLKAGRKVLYDIAGRMAEKYALGKMLDLGGVTVIVPGKRAGRRLCEILAEIALERGLLLVPPEVETGMSFLRRLALDRADGNFASPMESQLAWRKVLCNRMEVVMGLFPDGKAMIPLDELGEFLGNLRLDLARALVSVEDVMKCEGLPDNWELGRWESVRKLFSAFKEELLESGLLDEIMMYERFVKDGLGERIDADLWLICQVEKNPLLWKVLEKGGFRLAVVSVGDETWFDGNGILADNASLGPLPGWVRKRLRIFANPIMESQAVWQTLEKECADGKLGRNDIAVVSQSPDMLESLRAFGEKCGSEIHAAQGMEWSLTEPGLFLSGMREFIASRDEGAIMNLLRLPCVELSVRKETRAFEKLEEMIPDWQRRLQKHLGECPESWMLLGKPDENGQRKDTPQKKVLEHLNELAEKFSGEKSIKEWGAILDGCFDGLVKGSRPEDQSAWDLTGIMVETLKSCRIKVEKMEVKDFLELLTFTAKKYRLAVRTENEAIDLVGWLETVLDDSPLLFLCDVNEGVLPKGHGSDPFLPEGLRKLLGMPTTEQQFLRDRYFLRLLCTKEERNVHVFSTRQSLNGDRLSVSRLLCDEEEEPKVRSEYVLSFYGAENGGGPESLHELLYAPARKKEAVNPEDFLKPDLGRLSASDLNAYKNCPLMFVFGKSGLEAVENELSEMPANILGNLAHEVLELMARAKMEGTLPYGLAGLSELKEFLKLTAEEVAGRHFGNNPPPLLYLQLGQLKEQFMNFALAESEWEEKGWRIKAAEQKLEYVMADCTLVAKIDRLDVLENPGEAPSYCVIDYKTGAKKKDEKAREEDLQLPCYRLVLGSVFKEEAKWSYNFVEFSADRGEKKYFEPAPFDGDYTKKVLETIGELKKGDFKAAPSSSTCSYCRFKLLCLLMAKGEIKTKESK